MTLKTKPDLHFAPLPDGVYVGAGSQEFALRGWSGFADLMRTCLPLLGRGTGEDELVDLLGTEGARPAVRSLLGQLDQHGMVIHLDRLSVPEPDEATRESHAELLAYLECRSLEPYAALQEILGAPVLLVGPDDAVAVAERAVRELGMRGERGAEDGPSQPHEYAAAITVLGRDQVDMLPPRVQRFLPVVVGPSGVLVGPFIRDLADWGRWRTLVPRTLDRPGAPVQRDPATTIAVSTAVQLLLQELAGVSGPAGFLVSGDTFEVNALDLPPTQAATPSNVDLESAADQATDLADVIGWLSSVTDPILGPAEPHYENALPQMPVALRRLRLRDGSFLFGQGVDQQRATASAVLAAGRVASSSSAAGTSQRRWLLDGALRSLTPHVVQSDEHPELTAEGQRLAAALERRTEGPSDLVAFRLPGVSWALVGCRSGTGSQAFAWGVDVGDAAQRALSRSVAAEQLGADGSALLSSVCTDALLEAGVESVATLSEEIGAWLAVRGHRLSGRTQVVDPLLPPAPLWTGWVRIVRHGKGRTIGRTTVETLARLVGDLTDAAPSVTEGWDQGATRTAMDEASLHGTAMVPVEVSADRIVIGPVWSRRSGTACPACAETRRRVVLDHVLVDDLTTSAVPPGSPTTALVALAEHVVTASGAPRPGELLIVGSDGVGRHSVTRFPGCRWCTEPASPDDAAPLTLPDAATTPGDPTRVAAGSPLLREDELESRVIDSTYGPVRAILREETMPFAMSMAVLAGGPVMGHGRALRYDETRSVAVLEAYERLAGFPFEAPLLTDRAYVDLADRAIDPLRLGQYSATQLNHPTTKVVPYSPHLPIDWTVGTDLATGALRLVPAEVGFYQYDYTFKRDRVAAQASEASERRRCFLESSSGCALGSTTTEAAIHALFEVAERDAFQLAWHRAQALPQVDVDQLRDPVIEELVALVRSRGFEVHVLIATQDIDLPVLWILATARDGSFPAAFNSAGSGGDPLGAIRSGLREVAQLVTMPLDWTVEDARRLVADPWEVRELEDHVRYSSAPEMAERIRQFLGGPTVSLAEAYPGWPDALAGERTGIKAALDGVRERFARAGLHEIVVVDQSTTEHRGLGIHVVKAVVPGSVPMVFGYAHQRVQGIPRLDRALADAGIDPQHLDPHPFP